MEVQNFEADELLTRLERKLMHEPGQVMYSGAKEEARMIEPPQPVQACVAQDDRYVRMSDVENSLDEVGAKNRQPRAHAGSAIERVEQRIARIEGFADGERSQRRQVALNAYGN